MCILTSVVNKSKLFERIPYIFLWATYAFRDSVGVDDGGYIKAFDYINLGWDFDIEFSYYTISNIAILLGFNYKFVFFVYATIAFVMLYKASSLIFESRIDRVAFIMAFFGTVFVSSLTVMRQFTAACVCFYSFAYLYRFNKILVPLVANTFACAIHGGSVLSMPMLLLFYPNLVIKNRYKFAILTLCIFCGYANLATELLNVFMGYIPASYQIYEDSITGSFSSAGGTLSILIAFLFYLQITLENKIKRQENGGLLYAFLEKGQLAYLAILFFFVHAGVASRLAFTFLPFVATIPITIMNWIPKEQRIIVLIPLAALMLMLYMLSIASTALAFPGTFIPYNASFDFT